MRVLHVASEVTPFAKTGGLADVVGALPRQLAQLGCEVTVVAPRYKSIAVEKFGLARWLRALTVPVGNHSVEIGVWEGTPPGGSRVKLFLIEHESFNRDGIYGPPSGGDFGDNAWRYAILGAGALAIAEKCDNLPQILHGHDWQAGPALVYAHRRHPTMRLLLTIHNLAYQGIFGKEVVDAIGLGHDLFHPDGFEFYGNVSLLKAGIALAHRITTVSPGYAKEIQTPEQGMGLDGLLLSRAAQLTGILNGCDYEVWNPERDPHLAARYTARDLDGKRTCKAALQREMRLPERRDLPLCGIISRLADQKGFDLIMGALPAMLSGEVQCVILGSGDPGIQEALLALAKKHPKKLAVKIGFDERLAHRIEAGCDLYLMPSKYEPCGLNQMYSLRYGTPPIVRATGGLDDTIVDHDGRSATGTGFKFRPYTVEALAATWRRAILTWHSTQEFAGLVRRAMAQDFSWRISAQRYYELYRHVIE